MRAALALMMVVAAACGGDAPGLRLEIRAGTTGAQRIELYLGTRPCLTCDGMLAPKGATGKLAGEVWYLDGTAAAGTPNTAAALVDGTHVYDLRPEDPDRDGILAHVLVVGYDAQGTVVGVAALADVPVYHAATEWYRVTLGPAVGAVSSDRTTPAGERVYVWRRASPELAACVGYEVASDDGVKRRWFVPEDDTDCDQVTAAECDEFTYLASGTPHVGDANCVTAQFSVPGTNAGSSCLLGGPACIDGQNASDGCSPVGPSYCLPDAICARVGCAQDLGMCLRDGQTNPVPRIHCRIPYNQAAGGDPCLQTLQRHAEIDLGPLLVNPASPGSTLTTCKSVLFADTMLGEVNVTNKISAGQVEIKPDPLVAPCAFGMLWAAGNATSLIGNASILRMMIVELANQNRLLVPIEVQFRPTACEANDIMTCEVLVPTTDGLTSCARQ